MDSHETIAEFDLELCDLVDRYKNKLHHAQIGHTMIAGAVSISLYCAPNELLGMKSIMASMAAGIDEYECTFS